MSGAGAPRVLEVLATPWVRRASGLGLGAIDRSIVGGRKLGANGLLACGRRASAGGGDGVESVVAHCCLKWRASRASCPRWIKAACPGYVEEIGNGIRRKLQLQPWLFHETVVDFAASDLEPDRRPAEGCSP